MSSYPPLIFGTSSLGNLYVALSRETKRSIISEVVKQADIHNCSVMFDTAGKYGAGLALEELGAILTELGISPQEVAISNKLGWKRVPLQTSGPTFELDIWVGITNDAVQVISHDGITDCFNQGNELLGGTFRTSIVSMHDPDEYIFAGPNRQKQAAAPLPDCERYERLKRKGAVVEAIRTMHQWKNDGLVERVGIGSKDIHTIVEIQKEVPLDWAMTACSFTIYSHPPEMLQIFEKLRHQNVIIINSAIFNAGFLLGGDHFNYVKINEVDQAPLFHWRKQFFQVCEEFQVPALFACVQFSWRFSNNCISSIAVNPSEPRHVKEYYDAIAPENRISDNFWHRMQNLGLIGDWLKV
jgi:D-threo-aldose 1-dehydrogenase